MWFVCCSVTGDTSQPIEACRRYRACKQRKLRNYKKKYVAEIEKAFSENRSNLWPTINRMINKPFSSCNAPEKYAFHNYFEQISKPIEAKYFDKSVIQECMEFLQKYDMLKCNRLNCNLENDIINQNFTLNEITSAIDSLKNNKAPGTDCIPSEFFKQCKNQIAGDLVLLFNYFVEYKEFPDIWCEGVKSALFKSGDFHDLNNYRGITILPVIENIFEMAFYRRMMFVNEAFNKIDINNGGFLPGSRTSDNIFILNGLIQRQLAFGRNLYVCFVDFSKAFDMISRHILFYKLIKQGWHGRVIDTVRNLYSKITFRVERHGMLCPVISNSVGVNQGGVASGLFFRKFMADLHKYLKTECGICMSDTIIAYLLWADDLILLSDTEHGLQKQLDGLAKFCSRNHMIVNELKTKVMVFGKHSKCDVKFNECPIAVVQKYKYLGVIIRTISRISQDAFSEHYGYLCDKARKASFSSRRKLKSISPLPVKCMFSIFESLKKTCSIVWQ